MIPYLEPQLLNDAEASAETETDPEMVLFFDSLVWEEADDTPPTHQSP